MNTPRDGECLPPLLLSCVGTITVPEGGPRLFECKTCSRRFPSFQALGGHRTSHNRLRKGEHRDLAGRRVHCCPVCGMEFPMGQALGGHMRRHRHGVMAVLGHRGSEVETKLPLWDLNLPPAMDL